MTPKNATTIGHPIAIIGMGCIFPESRNLKEYWRLLFQGIDAIGPVPENSHWQLKDYFDADPARPDHTYCNRGGFLPDIAFDPLSYGMPPNNLEATDTSQLLGLEVARMALADAGYPPGHEVLQQRKVNVILGVTGTQELVIPLGARLGHPLWKKAMDDAGLDPEKREELLERFDRSYVQWQENSFPGLLGNVVAGRIANRLNLSGTNSVSDAACASSLSAIHTAVMELQTGRCDMSITGGVDTLNDIFMHMCFSKTGVLSRTSDAKPFSKEADGTVLGEGIGMIVLKRLADAERDRDRIYAVIRGVGSSSDGRTSAIYAPEAKGQLKALKDAYEQAGVDPSSVGLIEAHGTGTRVGDRVEFSALKQLFNGASGASTTAIGSVKSMIGHTKAAAGAAGIIKTALALHHKIIPPTLKADTPDPDLHIQDSAFYLNADTKPWVASGADMEKRRSGISAFGFGGSNFHAVLEEYQGTKSHISWDGSVQILALSAGDRKTLKEKLAGIRKTIQAYDPADQFAGDQAAYDQAVAWQAHESRKTFFSTDRFRLLILITQEDDFAALMDKADKIVDGQAVLKPPIFFGMDAPNGKLGFVFPGQGSQYTGMAKDIASVFPEAMDALALGQSSLSGSGSSDHRLSQCIFPLPEYVLDKKTAEEILRQTEIAQPAIGAASLAMAEILKRFNISPDMTCGHSFGELSALYAAGWMDKKDFLELAAARGRYMAEAGTTGDDPGSMLAVQAPMENIQTLMDEEGLDLVLANKNSPAQGVLSGATKEILKAQKCCRKRKMRAVRLPVAAAFHSRLVEHAAVPFTAAVSDRSFTPTKVDVLSNTTGGFYPRDEDEIRRLLGSQLMHPVNFTDNIRHMHDSGISTFLEIGPKAVLSGLINAILSDNDIRTAALDPSSGKTSGILDLASAICFVAAQGYRVNLEPWEDPAEQPVPKKMTVMLSGANLKPSRSQLPPVRPSSKPVSAPSVSEQAPRAAAPVKKTSFPAETKKNETQGIPMTSTPQNTGSAGGNLLQQGLEAMQQLQAQTARAHEKFLETQAQASQTLAQLMAQTRSVPFQAAQPAVSEMPAASVPPIASIPPIASAPQPVSAPQAVTASALEQPAPVQAGSAVQPEPVKAQEPANQPAPETGIQAVLFETVSRLTGFPVEMLEPEMDIESDLGIDSIKKVEIISELEKAMPQGHGMSSEHLSSVRTLGDICGVMGASPAAPSVSDASVVPAPADTENSGSTFDVLVRVISDLTGFPVEMLEPEMNLESDLGIDSIKRVEILSKLEQELTDLAAVSPDEMGTLKTIGDIVRYISPDNRENQDSEGAASPSKKKLRMNT